MDNKKEINQPLNEGEGNRSAARDYNGSQQRFVRSGKVEQKAREAEHDLSDESIRRELADAEAIGRRHSAGEDPQITRSPKKN